MPIQHCYYLTPAGQSVLRAESPELKCAVYLYLQRGLTVFENADGRFNLFDSKGAEPGLVFRSNKSLPDLFQAIRGDDMLVADELLADCSWQHTGPAPLNAPVESVRID